MTTRFLSGLALAVAVSSLAGCFLEPANQIVYPDGEWVLQILSSRPGATGDESCPNHGFREIHRVTEANRTLEFNSLSPCTVLQAGRADMMAETMIARFVVVHSLEYVTLQIGNPDRPQVVERFDESGGGLEVRMLEGRNWIGLHTGFKLSDSPDGHVRIAFDLQDDNPRHSGFQRLPPPQ